MTAPPPLPKLFVKMATQNALIEDLGGLGDRTSDLTIPSDLQLQASIVSREQGIFCGMQFISEAFEQIDPEIDVVIVVADGETIAPHTIVAHIKGPARGLFAAERVALNFAGHLSGIATTTSQMVAAIKGTSATIAATRKTLPGLRSAQKYAVICGGGRPHRFGLSDGILIKDNHIAAAGGIKSAVESAMAGRHHLESIVVEVATLDQLAQTLIYPIQGVLLDNMMPETIAAAVAMINRRFTAEASGGINLDNVRSIAECGVDVISCGWVTHSSRNLDLGLDVTTT